LGRWDIRYATGEKAARDLPDPFAPLPVCPPGMLQNAQGLPLSEEEFSRQKANGSLKYPIEPAWEGVLVDECDENGNPLHPLDIERRVRDVIEVIWKERAETVEQEACEMLGIKRLRDYLRKSGSGGFWMDHVARYSKSRRKAPIYWLLQSARKNYALWIYFHRLERDTLNKALVNYVEPKLRLENNRLQELRGKVTEVGTTGSAARDLDRKIERQEELISELNDFQDKLRRAADLHLEPDLNDGVVLNIAALWELVPWKEAKKYWEELLNGKYEWSAIGKQLKAQGLVKR
jgi:hypothetical protein